ncbi:MAG: N-formylglutamate amidohydrolase [Pseudomonadota bacterium]
MPDTPTGAMPDTPLLGSTEPPPFERFNEGGKAPILLVCDHASARIPSALGTLGLDKAELARHIAIDIGAAALTMLLARAFDAPAVLASYSRLVIDCNREPADHTSIREISEGVIVPGNRRLATEQRRARIEAVFDPYHAAIAESVDAMERGGGVPALVSVHSFTPRFRGFERPWQVGILSNRDRRVADPLLAALSTDPALVVGDNEPYSAMRFAGYTMDTHASQRGLPSAMIEVRQDEIGHEEGVERWAKRLFGALEPVFAQSDLYRKLSA